MSDEIVVNNLYYIQDNDAPKWVIAANWMEALQKWREIVALDNDQESCDVDEPCGIHMVCKSDDLIL